MRPLRIHEAQGAPSEQPTAVAESFVPSTATRVQVPKQISVRRRDAGARASKIVARAVARLGASAIARVLDIHHKRVNDWCDPGVDAAMSLRDILAVGGDFAREVLSASLAALDASQPALNLPLDRHALRLQSAVGELSQSLERAEADGQVTADEIGDLVEKLHKAMERLQQFERDLRAKQG